MTSQVYVCYSKQEAEEKIGALLTLGFLNLNIEYKELSKADAETFPSVVLPRYHYRIVVKLPSDD